jgi:hypothetical protein
MHLETSIKTLENFLYNEVSDINKSVASKEDNFPNIYNQSSDLFSGDELFPGNGDGLWVLNDFSPELSPQTAAIFTEKEEHTLLPISYENRSKYEDHSVHSKLTNHLTTDIIPIVKYPLETVDEHVMTDKDEKSSSPDDYVQQREWKQSSRPQRNKIETKRFNTKHNLHVHSKKRPVHKPGERAGSTNKERQLKETKQKVNVPRNKNDIRNKLVKSYESKSMKVLKSKPWI